MSFKHHTMNQCYVPQICTLALNVNIDKYFLSRGFYYDEHEMLVLKLQLLDPYSS